MRHSNGYIGRLGAITDAVSCNKVLTRPRPNQAANRIVNTYESTLVQRYHTHPRLARFGQTNGQHQCAVASLILHLHPNPSISLIKEAISHDSGERYTGDVSSPAKRLNPVLKDELSRIEASARFEKTLGVNVLERGEIAWLRMVDMLECYLFAAHTIPECLETKNWERLRGEVITAASNLRIQPKTSVLVLMETAKERKGLEENYG